MSIAVFILIGYIREFTVQTMGLKDVSYNFKQQEVLLK